MKQMKHVKLALMAIVVMSLLATGAVAYAQGGELPPGGPGGFGTPLGGEVTAISDTSLTAVSPDGETITANLTDETSVFVLVTQSEGTLADVQVGTTVEIMGRPDDTGVVSARGIVIVPPGDVVRGEVTTVDGDVLIVEDIMPVGPPSDTTDNSTPTVNTVVMNETTQVFVDGVEGLVSDVAVGQHAVAYGETQDDGSLTASVVIVSDSPQAPGPGGAMSPGGPGGERPAGGPGGGPGGGRRQ